MVGFLRLSLFLCENTSFAPSVVICVPLIHPLSCGNPISTECLCSENVFNVLSETLKHKTIHEHGPGLHVIFLFLSTTEASEFHALVFTSYTHCTCDI